ncbi:MAG: 23S rRNA (guanosine(2251)-2'-O)-methyltransferase RlmB [Caulobacter sp.]|nr:23S rRNA (guanosine(2251)-2'-O)-methyltransferase RlmB [Caulobacter sp.]
MSSSRERNDRKTGNRPRPEKREKSGPPRVSGRSSGPDAKDWLWGVHAVEAALANPRRAAARRLLATADRAKALNARFGRAASAEILDGQDIARLLPPGAVHQGVAMKIEPLEPLSLDALGQPAEGLLLMLDQVTDPQNVGAIFRSAAAFGARGVILQDRNAPTLSGALAKAAVGAVDRIPHASVVNLSRALEQLADMGWRAVGLAGEADLSLEAALDARPTVLVMGSEGDGLRRLVAEHCEVLAKIPMPGGFESINVSNAAAIALYEASRARALGEQVTQK